MSAAPELELGDELAGDDDHQDQEHHDEAAATARRIAGYLIVGGVVIAGLCVAFLVWEQWQANRAVLQSLEDNFSPDLAGFPVESPPSRRQAPDPGPQDQPGTNPSSEAAEGGPLE